MIRWLTAVVIFSILWFGIILLIGMHAHDPQVTEGLPGLYIGGNIIYAVILTIRKMRQ